VKGILAPSTTTTFLGRDEYLRAALTAVDSIYLKDELLLLLDSIIIIIILKLLFRTMATTYEIMSLNGTSTCRQLSSTALSWSEGSADKAT